MKKQRSAEVHSDGISKIRKTGRGRYEVRWVEVTETREDRAFTSSERDEVEAKRRELLAQKRSAKISLKKLPKFDGKSRFFKTAMGDVVKAAHGAASVCDSDALDSLDKYSRILTGVAKGYLPYGDSAEVEEELEKLIKYHEETDRRSQVEDATEQDSCTSIADSLVGDTRS